MSKRKGTGPPRPCRKWTDEEVKHLRQLVEDGLSSPVIGRRLGRSRHSVRMKLIELAAKDEVAEVNAEGGVAFYAWPEGSTYPVVKVAREPLERK